MTEETSRSELEQLEQRVRGAAGIAARIVEGRVELVPSTIREAARAQAARALLGPRASQVTVNLAALDQIDPPDASSCTVRAGVSAGVEEIEARLRGCGLTLGSLSPKVRTFTLGQWLEGPSAGLRVIPGNRLESAALSVVVALEGGGLYSGVPAPRSAVGPVLEGAILGCGGQAGMLLAAVLRAMPRSFAIERVHAAVERAEQVARLLRQALNQDVPFAEARVERREKGFMVDMEIATHSFRAQRDRKVLEELARRAGELLEAQRIQDRAFVFEGEIAWDRLASSIEQASPLALYRMARESLVVAAEGPLQGAVALDAPSAPLPEPFLSALRSATGEGGPR